MGPKEAADQIQKKFSAEVIEVSECRGQVIVTVRKAGIRAILQFLHDTSGLEYHLLTDICGVDYMDRKEPRFEVVYNLYSLTCGAAIRIKAQVPENDLSLDSVVSIWSGADWRERECFDMFGIRFCEHPDLRRLLMPDDWDGFPLRKDYPLESDLGEREWKGYKDVIETANKNRAYGVQ